MFDIPINSSSVNMSDSTEYADCTPPTITEAAKEVTLELLPPKSKEKYKLAYQQFMDWRKKVGIVSSFSENTLLAYFGQLSKKIAPNTLWTMYSMLKCTLAVYQNVHIAQYQKLRTLLKRNSTGYKPKKSKTLTPEEISRFINEAPDDTYLLQKVILIIGISGACRKQELVNLNTNNIEELKSAAVIRIPDTKTNKTRTFTITGNFFEIYKKYSALRPSNLKGRFFLNYQNKKCTKQYVGINKIGSTPKLIATYLGLKEPQLYTGHCYRRSSATILVDAGGDITALKRHGGWQSTSVAEGYIQESLQNKMKVANTILNSVNETCRTSPLPGTSSSPTFISMPEASSSPLLDVINKPPPPVNVSAVCEQNLQTTTTTHPVNFYNCSNNQITINFLNNVKQ